MKTQQPSAETLTSDQSAIITAVSSEFAVGICSSIRKYRNEYSFNLDGMPVLPYFTSLAERFGVPLESIRVECSASASSGCPTCGPDVEMEIEVTIKVPA